MNIAQMKQVFRSDGKTITDAGIPGYYRVDGGKHRSARSLEREAKMILKQQMKAAKRGDK